MQSLANGNQDKSTEASGSYILRPDVLTSVGRWTMRCGEGRHSDTMSEQGFDQARSTQVLTPPTQATLLAASTLAQTASMAALSSRRRAFFSLALFDFLWMQEGGKRCNDIKVVTAGYS